MQSSAHGEESSSSATTASDSRSTPPNSRSTATAGQLKQETPSSASKNGKTLEECDYDKTCTALYKAIEGKKWEFVTKLLEEAENESSDDEEENVHENGNNSPSTKKRKEAAVWVVRKERDGRLRWRLLPLHAALIFNAPVRVVEALLRVFPPAATMKDDQGMLPLHLACRNAPVNFEVLEELLTAHPAAVYVKDRKGRTPIQGGLTATGSDKNPGLSAMELYTQILAAGEKQRWRTEHEHQTSQKLQMLASQQETKIETLRKGYESEIATQKENFSITTGSLSAQLKAARIQVEQLKKEKEDIKKEYFAQNHGVSKEEYEKIGQTNRQLHGIVQILLDQHNSLQESLQTLQKDQETWHEERNALMRQYCTVNEQAAATSQAHASIWQEELSSTEKHIRATLKKIPLVSKKEKEKPSESASATAETQKHDKSCDTTTHRTAETASLSQQPTSESSESLSSGAATKPHKEKRKGRNTSKAAAKALSRSSSNRGSHFFNAEQEEAIRKEATNDSVPPVEPITKRTPPEKDVNGSKFEEEKKDETLQPSVSVILSDCGAEIMP